MVSHCYLQGASFRIINLKWVSGWLTNAFAVENSARGFLGALGSGGSGSLFGMSSIPKEEACVRGVK